MKLRKYIKHTFFLIVFGIGLFWSMPQMVFATHGPAHEVGAGDCGCPPSQVCERTCPSGSNGWVDGCSTQCKGYGGGSCNRPGVPVDCPPNTIRSNTVASSVCMGFCSLGTAQKNSGTCCDWVDVPESDCEWEDCGTINNPDKLCKECATPAEHYCRTNITNTYVCTPICAAGPAPALSLPANGQIYAGPSGAASVDFAWTAAANWGTETAAGSRSYTLCVGSNASNPCTGGASYSNAGTTPAVTKTASVPAGQKYWNVKAVNQCGQTSVSSTIQSVCIEGNTLPADNGVGNAYYSQWGACNATTHKRTRTCTEDCGTDNCTAAAAAGLLEEDCEGQIRGTLFDATNLVSCPSFDPITGYSIGVDTTLTANSRAFGISDQSSTAPHPWAPLSTVQTDSSGNYAVNVYAPATYTYDFTNLKDMYVVSSGPKLTCTSLAATVPGNSSNCGTQPCSKVNNMSFGFNRYWSGWWQTVGAGVHAENGLRSSIPSSMPSEQSLILADSNSRRGVATYGQLTTNMLGVNANAKVSTNLWQALSNYGGVIYDYGFFNQQFKKYATTVWDGVAPISYDDNGSGYQIFKVTGDIANFNYSPTGTQKVMFLVNGSVTISSDVVVPDGAFLAVISSGDINVATSVTRADGWYLADNINVRCIDANSDLECDRTDVQFAGNGSFVGWEGVNMTRDRGGVANIAGPSELFTYRLDLYNNAPEPMKIITKRYKPYVP